MTPDQLERLRRRIAAAQADVERLTAKLERHESALAPVPDSHLLDAWVALAAKGTRAARRPGYGTQRVHSLAAVDALAARPDVCALFGPGATASPRALGYALRSLAARTENGVDAQDRRALRRAGTGRWYVVRVD